MPTDTARGVPPFFHAQGQRNADREKNEADEGKSRLMFMSTRYLAFL